MSLARATIRHLRSPSSGLLGQMLRFGLSGGTVALLYVTVTTLLSQAFGVAFQIALAIGFVLSVMLHFNLQRLFVWLHDEEFALGLRHQVGRYLAMAGTQYGITAAATSLLPGALGVSTEAVYLVTLVIVTTAGFLIMRLIIFHASDASRAP
jgi:putative flippase GtrA